MKAEELNLKIMATCWTHALLMWVMNSTYDLSTWENPNLDIYRPPLYAGKMDKVQPELARMRQELAERVMM